MVSSTPSDGRSRNICMRLLALTEPLDGAKATEMAFGRMVDLDGARNPFCARDRSRRPGFGRLAAGTYGGASRNRLLRNPTGLDLRSPFALAASKNRAIKMPLYARDGVCYA